MKLPQTGILKVKEAAKKEERKFQLSTFEKLAKCIFPAKEEAQRVGAMSPLGGEAKR
jgi:hypothetical protein